MKINIIRKPIVYVDLDDTLCNFTLTRDIMLEKNPHIPYPQSQYGFYMNLSPREIPVHITNLLREFCDVYILTRASYLNPLCYTEKRVWVEKHFDLEFCQNLIICGQKHLLKGDFLIDDVEHKGFEGIWKNPTSIKDWKTLYYEIRNYAEQGT